MDMYHVLNPAEMCIEGLLLYTSKMEAVFIRVLCRCLQDALRPDRSSATHFGMPAVSTVKLDVGVQT